MKTINTSNAPAAIGPYSQAVEIENLVIYTSGQLGIDPKTSKMGQNITEQTKNSLNNIEGILTEAGYSKNNIVKVLVLLKDINDFSEMNKVYEEFFGNHKPARSAFQVAALPLNGLIEIEVIAYKK